MPAAMNFISGGAPLGASVVSSAANKIVGFQRGATAVAAKPPDLASIIKTLSTNILNNVENRVQSINQNIQQFVQGNFNKQLGEYKEKLQSVDNDTPNKILRNFLSLYKDAIGYIQFLGNKKNAQQLGQNLQTLQQVFSETFEVAKIIRQTIVKIVKQLSNLPKSSSSGGAGIDLDIRVPGGPLRRALPSRRSMLKMAGLAGVIGGAGMLGSKVVSGMMDIGGEDQITATPSDSGQGLSGPLLDKFNALLDRFDAAINSLTKRTSTGKTSSGGGGSSNAPKPSQTPSPGGAPSAGPGGTVDPSKISADTPQAKAFLATVGSTEASSYNTIVGGQQIPELTKMTIQEVYDMGMKSPLMTGRLPDRFGGRTIRYGYNSHAMGKYQFIPDTMMSAARSAGLKPTDLYSPENQDKLALAYQVSLGGDPNKGMDEKNYRIAGSTPAWEGMRKISYAEAKKRYDQYLVKAQGSPSTPQATAQAAPPQQPGVAAASTQQENTQRLAQSVAQPPSTQSKAQVNVVPLDMSTPQAQSAPKGQQAPPPPVLSKGGASVPFLTSTNHDNFMTLYSKIVYSLVD